MAQSWRSAGGEATIGCSNVGAWYGGIVGITAACPKGMEIVSVAQPLLTLQQQMHHCPRRGYHSVVVEATHPGLELLSASQQHACVMTFWRLVEIYKKYCWSYTCEVSTTGYRGPHIFKYSTGVQQHICWSPHAHKTDMQTGIPMWKYLAILSNV